MTRKSFLILAAVLAVGAAVRLYRISAPGLTSDEAFTWRLTGRATDEVLRGAAADVHPPLYYLLMKGWVSLAGSSPLALRSLSVLLGLALLLIVHRLTRDSVTAAWSDGRLAGKDASSAATLASAFAAVHVLAVEASRNARMYALGMLLAALSALLLVRALASPGARRRWLAYGLASAALVLTHYYGGFTVAAQGLWAVIHIGRKARREPAAARRAFAGLLLAAVVALALFAPWLPVLRHQTASVMASYWISPTTPASLTRGLASWMLGVEDPTLASAGWVVAVLLPLGVVAAWRGGPAGGFFATQAALPWLLGLAISFLGHRPIFLERYMAFAFVGWAGLWGVAWARRDAMRVWHGVTLALLLAVGTQLAGFLHRIPEGVPAEVQAACFLAERVRPGDVVLVPNPYRLNRLKYYAQRCGAPDLPLRCVLDRSEPARGHVPHLASLAPGDVVWSDAVDGITATRVWWGDITGHPWPAAASVWQTTGFREFGAADGPRYYVTRYRRSGAPPETAPLR